MTNEAGRACMTDPPADIRCEIAVIGSGPGGSITSALLAEAGRDVLMIEEGPFLASSSCSPFSREEMEQKYRNGGINVTWGRPKVAYEEARCVGGGSEVNSGLYYRLPHDVSDRWERDFGLQTCRPDDLLPHYESIEQELGVSTMPGAVPVASRKLHEGAQKLGWESAEVPRWYRYADQQENVDTPVALRNSMTETFVPRSFRAGAKLLPNTRALRILKRDRQWLIKCRHTGTDGQRSVAVRAATLFACCGAIHTPTLLRRSGIRHNVGNSLCMHPTVKIIARFPDEVNYDGMGVPVHGVREFAPRFFFTCSISAPAYLALGMSHFPGELKSVDGDWKKMAVYAAMTTGGRGTVRCVPGFLDPLVRYEFSSDDLEQAAEATKKLCRLLLASGAEAVYPGIPLEAPLRSEADLDRIPTRLPRTRLNFGTVHLFSSCPMGENKVRCATDSFGKVHDVDNLYVADASLLCTAPCVNPQGPTMAIVRRNALKFLGEL